MNAFECPHVTQHSFLLNVGNSLEHKSISFREKNCFLMVIIQMVYDDDRAYRIRNYGFVFAFTIDFSFDLG